MHVQLFPPSPAFDQEEEVEDNLRRVYRAPPPRNLPPRLQALLDLLHSRGTEAPPLPPLRRALRRG